MTDLRDGEFHAILSPIGDGQVVLTHRSDAGGDLGALGGQALNFLRSLGQPQAAPAAATTQKLFTTTPEVEALMAANTLRDAPGTTGHVLPVVIDADNRFVRQAPLKEVDPSLLIATSDPAMLAVRAAAQLILAQLDHIEEQIRHVRADTQELLDRWDGRQKAELRAILLDLKEFVDSTDTSGGHWRQVEGYRKDLMTLHGEFTGELQRIAQKIKSAASPVAGWAEVGYRDAQRIDALVQLELLVVQALERWTLLYLLQLDGTSLLDASRENAMNRVRMVRSEADTALSRVPIAELPEKPLLKATLARGVLPARRQLRTARANRAAAATSLKANPQPLQLTSMPPALQICTATVKLE